MTERVPDDRLAAALTEGAAPAAGGCPPSDRAWDAATGALAPSDVRALLDHAARCPDCTLALHAARALAAEAGLAAAARPERSASLGEWFARTFLAPRPALVYLLLLAASWPAYRLVTNGREPLRPAESSAMSAVRTLELSGDVQRRGGSDGGPAAFALPPGDGPLLLRLHVDPTDVPAGSAIRVRLIEGERPPIDVGASLEGNVVAVLLDPRALVHGRAARVEVVVRAPGAEPRTVVTATLAP